MLITSGDEDCRSAGSFFKNPIVDAATFVMMQSTASERGLTMPAYPAPDARGSGGQKIPAAWLVENSGFAKGYTLGRAGISQRHALAIVNRGGATAAEIIALKDAIQDAVAALWKVHLEPEPVMLGF